MINDHSGACTPVSTDYLPVARTTSAVDSAKTPPDVKTSPLNVQNKGKSLLYRKPQCYVNKNLASQSSQVVSSRKLLLRVAHLNI